MANPALLPLPTVGQLVHREAIRAVKRTMDAIEGAGWNYCAGVYYADAHALELAREAEAERLLRKERWNLRRALFGVVAQSDEGQADADVLERQREAQQAGEDADEPLALGYYAATGGYDPDTMRGIVHTVRCSWCGVTIVEGDPELPVSHGICLTCADKLDKADPMRKEDDQC